MGRLIDADVLYGLIEEKVFDSEVMCPVIKMTDVLELIDAQPTAYDIEKVVAELENRSNDVITNIFASEDDDHYGIYNNGMSEGYDNAIEIVRKGGVEC